MNTTSTKWWWNKKSTKKIQSIASSINEADEGASMFSLYSYDPSMYCSSYHQISSSIKAHHTKSEYSVNFSDVDTNASIKSRPWISRNVIENKSLHESIQDETLEEEEDDDHSSLGSEQEHTSLPATRTPAMAPKRRASLVDYLVSKPLHGKIKVKKHVPLVNAAEKLI